MSTLPSAAIVLAAGLGTRMRPITDTLPKPLVPVGGKALIDYGLDALAEAGVQRAIVNVHHLADQLEAHLAMRKRPAITISDERERLLNSGGGFTKAARMTDDDPLLVLNADTFWIDAPGTNALRVLAAHWDPATMDMLCLMVPLDRAVGHTGRGDFALAHGTHGRLHWSKDGAVYAGAAIVSPRIIKGDEPEAHSFKLHFDRLIEAGRLHGVMLEGLWLTVGTPDAIEEAERAMNEYRSALVP